MKWEMCAARSSLIFSRKRDHGVLLYEQSTCFGECQKIKGNLLTSPLNLLALLGIAFTIAALAFLNTSTR